MLKKLEAKFPSQISAKNLPWGATEAIVGTIGLFLIPQLLAGAILVLAGVLDPDTDATATEIFTMVALVEIITMGGLWLLLNKLKAVPKQIGIVKKNVEMIWKAVPTFIVYIFTTATVAAILRVLLGDEVIDQDQEIGFEPGGGSLETSLAFVALVIFAPVAEEILFRGFLFQGLRRDMSLFWAVAISSIMFGIAHLQFNVSVDTAIFGVFLALIFYRTGNILVPIFLHMIKNFIAFYFLFINPEALEKLASVTKAIL